MIKLIFNLLQLYFFVRLIYKAGRFFTGKKKGKSIAGKISYLASNRIHASLDHRIKLQKKSLAVGQQSNLVPFRRKA